jgi:hypothetical protein
MLNQTGNQQLELFTGTDALAGYLRARGWIKDADLAVWHRTEPRKLSRSEQDAFPWQIAEDRSSGLEIVGLRFTKMSAGFYSDSNAPRET